MFACLLAFFLTYILTYFITFLHTYVLTDLIACLLARLLTYSLTYLLTHLLTYLLIYLLTYVLTLVFFPMRSIGYRRHFASSPYSGLSSPIPSRTDRLSAFLPRGFRVMCFWVSPLSLFLWIPGQGLPSDVAGRFPEGVASANSLSSQDLCGDRFLVSCPPLILLLIFSG